jgi:hypothetical protein
MSARVQGTFPACSPRDGGPHHRHAVTRAVRTRMAKKVEILKRHGISTRAETEAWLQQEFPAGAPGS